jgi:hypothetical protein
MSRDRTLVTSRRSRVRSIRAELRAADAIMDESSRLYWRRAENGCGPARGRAGSDRRGVRGRGFGGHRDGHRSHESAGPKRLSDADARGDNAETDCAADASASHVSAVADSFERLIRAARSSLA